MNENCYHIICHNDLDGMLSLLVFKWFHPQAHITFNAVSNLSVDRKIDEYLNQCINPHNIIVLDLALRESFLQFDSKNVTFIDHHKRSEEYVSKFKKSKIIYKEYSSNCKLLYKYLEKINSLEFTKRQKTLIAYGDDYDSGSHTMHTAYDLNILYWDEFKNDPMAFLDTYREGWTPFTKGQQKAVTIIKMDAVKEAGRYKLYDGDLTIFGKTVKCLATFGPNPNNISIDVIMTDHTPDIFFYINPDRNKIIIRQKKSDNMIDLAEFARKYCNGNGHQLTAGGKLTDLFMELTKNLKPIS